MQERDPLEERSSPVLSRRGLLHLLAAGPFALALADPAEAKQVEPMEPTAGRWQTWLAPSAAALRPPGPPKAGSPKERKEIRELLAFQRGRNRLTNLAVRFWDPQGGIPVWSRLLLETIQETRTDPVRASRALALMHAAIADTSIAVWNAKFHFRRFAPARRARQVRSLSSASLRLPSYPCEHAAIATAAATVLNYLYPNHRPLVRGSRTTFNELANEACLSRLWGGARFASDLNGGARIGRTVGQGAVERGQSDGSGAVWDPVLQPGRLVGPPYWEPTAPANIFPPLHPMAPFWQPWVLESADQFRAPVPPGLQGAFPNAAFLAETAEVKHTVDNLTPAQLQVARFWADNPGESFTPPGHWAAIAAAAVADAGLSTPGAARALALVAVGLADSAICCWDSKYAYWLLRPQTAIRTMSDQPFHDPDFLSPVGTPPFPAYTSGHSTFSGCAATLLEFLFPRGRVADAFGNRVRYSQAAEQAAVSRLFGGIHYRSDNEAGLVGGRMIGRLLIDRARRDGAP
jgi:hypothetical protein